MPEPHALQMLHASIGNGQDRVAHRGGEVHDLRPEGFLLPEAPLRFPLQAEMWNPGEPVCGEVLKGWPTFQLQGSRTFSDCVEEGAGCLL